MELGKGDCACVDHGTRYWIEEQPSLMLYRAAMPLTANRQDPQASVSPRTRLLTGVQSPEYTTYAMVMGNVVRSTR